MATLPANVLDNLRLLQHSAELNLSVFTPPILLAAQVTGGPSRGDRTISFTGGTGDISQLLEWMKIDIGTLPGGNDIETLRLKSWSGTTATGTITVDENGIDWQDGYHITIYRMFAPIAVQNRAVPTGDPNQDHEYKFYDLEYTASGDWNNFPGPIVIAGPPRVAELPPGGTVVIPFDLTGSYNVGPNTIASYDLGAHPSLGATVTFSQSTGTGQIEFDRGGEWWILAEAVNDDGKREGRIVPVRIHAVDDPPYTNFTINNIEYDFFSGMRFSLEAYGAVQKVNFPDSTICIVWIAGDKPADLTGSGNIVAVGYLKADRLQDGFAEDGSYQITFECDGIDAAFDNIPMTKVGLDVVEGNNIWSKFDKRALTLGRGLHFYMKWHTNMLILTDVLGLNSTTLDAGEFLFDSGSIMSSLNDVAYSEGEFKRLVSDEGGRLHLVNDIQLLNTSGRNAIDTTFDIIETDISERVVITRSTRGQMFRLTMSGGRGVVKQVGQSFSGDGDAYVSVIPAYRPSATTFHIMNLRGLTTGMMRGNLLASQQDCDERCGRVFAMENREIRDIRVTFRGNYFGALSVIGDLGFYRWQISDQTTGRDYNLEGKRLICRKINVRNNSDGDIEVSATLEPEVFGPNGVISDIPLTHPDKPTPSPGWEAPQGEEAIMTWSSVHYRTLDASEWDTISTENYNNGIVDLWWPFINNSVKPSDAIWWGVGDGTVNLHQYLNTAAVNVRPGLTSVTFGYAQITPGFITFTQVLADEWRSDRKYLIGHTLLSPPMVSADTWQGHFFVSNDFGGTWAEIPLYDTSGAIPPEGTGYRPIWMSVNNTHVMVTVWQDNVLYLRRWLASDLQTVDEYALGTATEAQLLAKERIAYPLRVLDANDDGNPLTSGFPIYVFGRMVDPAGLTGTYQAIRADDQTTWASVHSDAVNAEFIQSMKVSADRGGGQGRQIFWYKQEHN